VAEGAGDAVGLVNLAGPKRPHVNLDQSRNVWILGLNELCDSAQVGTIAQQIGRAWYGQMERGANAQSIANVIKKESHPLSVLKPGPGRPGTVLKNAATVAG
jgi:hypothetical protein